MTGRGGSSSERQCQDENFQAFIPTFFSVRTGIRATADLRGLCTAKFLKPLGTEMGSPLYAHVFAATQ